MDVWLLALYAVASFLALRSVVSLMTHHKQRFLRELEAAEMRERKRASKRKPGGAGSQERADTAA